MKALHLLNSLKHGGAENVACNYSLALQKLNIEPVIIANESSPEYLSMVLSKGIKVAPKLSKKELREVGYIFVHSNQNLVKLLPYFFILRRRGIRIFYVQHLNYTESKFKKLALLINLFCTDFIQITPITKKLVDKYIKIPVHFMVNFYINKYHKEQYQAIARQVREKYGIDSEQELIMFSAVFKPGKGLSDFLDLAYRFVGQDKYKFLIVGDGPQKELVEKYKGDNIIWTGFVNDVESYQIASDVYVFTSKFKQEMMPMALLEAINCDRRILAFDIELNDFCLGGQTFKTIDDMEQAIINDTVPQDFNYFDLDYALKKMTDILR